MGLQKNQRLICRRNLELMPVVVRAARQVIDVCQELFADRRWNCSSILLSPNYLADLTGGAYGRLTSLTAMDFRTLSPGGRGAKYCDECVCLSVCLSIYVRITHVSATRRPNFAKFLTHVARGRGSILL